MSEKQAADAVEKVLVEAIVRVRIPERGNLAPDAQDVYCFSYSVKGGGVPVRLHAENPEQFRGKNITARAVLKKVVGDGDCRKSIDLYPDNRTHRPVIHRLCVTGSDQVPSRYKSRQTRVHELSGALSGYIIFAPIG